MADSNGSSSDGKKPQAGAESSIPPGWESDGCCMPDHGYISVPQPDEEPESGAAPGAPAKR